MVLPEDLPHFPVARRNRPDLLQRGRLLDRIRQFQNRSDRHRARVLSSRSQTPSESLLTAVLVRPFPQGAESVSQSSSGSAGGASGCARTAVGLNTKRALPGPRIQRFRLRRCQHFARVAFSPCMSQLQVWRLVSRLRRCGMALQAEGHGKNARIARRASSRSMEILCFWNLPWDRTCGWPRLLLDSSLLHTNALRTT